MPKLSAFTPLGLLRLSRAPSQARVIYDVKVSSLGAAAGKMPAYATVEPGSRLDAKLYAESIRDALIRMLLRRAGDADDPHRIHPELVPQREQEYGIVPPADAKVYQRKRALAAAYRLPLGGSRYNIENTLRALLGSGFVYYRTFDPDSDERALYPTTIGTSPMNLKSSAVTRVLVTCDGIPSQDGMVPGLPMPDPVNRQKVYYTPVIPVPAVGGAPVLLGDEDLIIEPANAARCERVRVTNYGSDSLGQFFMAVIKNAHEPGSFATTMPFPLWVSNQRSALIVVKSAVIADANLVRQIHGVMRKLARAVSTWAIVENITATTCGPFKIGVSPLGSTPLGLTTFPYYPPV